MIWPYSLCARSLFLSLFFRISRQNEKEIVFLNIFFSLLLLGLWNFLLLFSCSKWINFSRIHILHSMIEFNFINFLLLFFLFCCSFIGGNEYADVLIMYLRWKKMCLNTTEKKQKEWMTKIVGTSAANGQIWEMYRFNGCDSALLWFFCAHIWVYVAVGLFVSFSPFVYKR